MSDPTPRTEAGRALAATWPFTRGRQTCCPYPHGENSADDDVKPAHQRVAITETYASAIIAIENEAAALSTPPPSLTAARLAWALNVAHNAIDGTEFNAPAGRDHTVARTVLAALQGAPDDLD